MTLKVLVARATFPDILDRLDEYFDVERNTTDIPFTPAALMERLRDKDGAMLMGGERIDEAVLTAAPRLRAVCNCAAGYNNFDMAAITKRGVIATNTPKVSDESVADFAWALLLAAARHVVQADRFVRDGAWRGFAYNLFLGHDLHHTTLGIIGMGGIGQAVARRAAGFGMRVLYCNRSRLPEAAEAACAARHVSKAVLLREADHVVLTLSYGPDSHHMIGSTELALMKRSTTLINVARGGIVDDLALARALQEGQIAAAGLDVFEGEPAVIPALQAAPNLVMSPHMASASVTTRRALANLAVDNLIAALGYGPQAGRPPSILNPSVLAGAS
jgi:gluconate 2-dehydrogenase